MHLTAGSITSSGYLPKPFLSYLGLHFTEYTGNIAIFSIIKGQMDTALIKSFVSSFTLNQRTVACLFRKDFGLNRTHVEILAFAKTVVCFNAYELHKRYIEMNMQQIRVGIRKMAQEGSIELISAGVKGKPSVYMITNKGKRLLDDYSQYWLRTLSGTD